MKWISCLYLSLALMGIFVQAEETHVELGTKEELYERMNAEIASFSTLDFVERVGIIDGTEYEMFFSIMMIDGNLVYCIEPGVFAGTGTNYSVNYDYLDEKTKEYLFRITNVGYQSDGHTEDKWFVATQLAIWRALGFTEYSAKTMEGEAWDVSLEVAEIERLAASFGNTASFSGQTLNVDKGEVITVKDDHGVLSRFEVLSEEGLDVVQDGNTLTLIMTGECAEKTISGSKGLKTGGLVYGRPGRQTVYMVTRSEEPVSYELNLKMKTGDVRIKKLNEEGKPASGIHQFVLFDEQGKRIDVNGAEVLEVQDGTIEIIGQLPKGNYTLKEINTVYPYQLAKHEVKFTVESEQMNEVQFVNEYADAKLTVLKKDKDTMLPLDDAEFTISVQCPDGTWEKVEQGITADGKMEAFIKYGKKVQVCETKAPQDYLISENACQIVELTPLENESVVVEFVNQKHQIPLVIRKKDKITNELLSGALFSIQVKNEADEWVEIAQKETHQGLTEEILLNAKEMIQVCEIKAPIGYTLPEEACQIIQLEENEEDKTVVEFEDELRQLTLRIIKKDAQTQELLNGAEFSISIYDGISGQWKEVDQKMTEKDGLIEVNSLNYGQRVRVCEVKAPQGYKKQETCQELEMISEMDDLEVVFENERRNIEVQVYKVDSEDGRLLNDAYFFWEKENLESGFGMSGRLLIQFEPNFFFPVAFEVFGNAEGTELLFEGSTDETGEWISECEHEEVFVRRRGKDELEPVQILPGGFSIGKVKYGEQIKVCEVIAPSGYQIQNECQWIDVKSDEDLLKVMIGNERIKSYEEVPSMGVD